MLEDFYINTIKYNEIMESVLDKAEKNERCAELLAAKDRLFTENPGAADILLELDGMLSDYYQEIKEIMYREITEQIVKLFYGS